MKKKRKSFIFNVLKLSFGIAFLLVWFESINNYSYFYRYFPRGGFFQIIFDSSVLRFLALPILQLAAVTILVYFLVIFFLILTLFSLYKRVKTPTKSKKLVFFSFSIISFYIGLYSIYSLNLFFHPLSSGRHFFPYIIFFPPAEVYQPFSFIRMLTIYVSFFYWAILFLIALAGSIGKKIFILPILFFAAFIFLFFKYNFSSQEKFYHEKNIIFIGIDSLQYNRLCRKWGYEKDLTPNICAFLKQANCFINAWTPFARTYPFYNSLLTGRYPINSGVRANLAPDNHLKKDNPYLGKILKSYGYNSFYSTDDARFSNIRKMHGFDQIFSPRKDVAGMLVTAFYNYTFTNILIRKNILPQLFKPVMYNRAHDAYNPSVFTNRVIEKIQQLPKDKPNFIVVHFCGNHQPYTTAYPYARNQYLECSAERTLQMVDNQFQKLLDYLKESGLYQRSLIVFFSDHGSGWDPKNRKLSHGSNFNYPWANRIVLAFGFPSGTKYASNINSLVRGVDIYPTVLEYLEIESSVSIDGKSLFPLLANKETSPRSLFAETGYNFKVEFSGFDFNLDPRKIQTELRSFKIDPSTGYVFIRDKDYQSLVEKKWYMIINNSKRLVYNPYLGIIKANRVNPDTGEDVGRLKEAINSTLTVSETAALKGKIIDFFKID